MVKEMGAVAVTGAGSQLGRKVRALLADEGGAEVRELGDVLVDDLVEPLDGTEAVLHLASGAPQTPTGATEDVAGTRRLLDAAAKASVPHVVMLSDATVYGAWPNNPVPLTDEAVLRPNPGFTYATERAELERLAGEWRESHPGTTVTILRPVRTPGRNDWLIRALRPLPTVPELAVEPPVQFLDLGDLASAVALAGSKRLDGAFNVAPDRLIPGDEVRSLTGVGPGCGCRRSWPIASPAGASAPGSARPRLSWCPTPCTRGWWRTTGCVPRAGRRRSPARRPASSPTRSARGPASARAAARRWPSSPPAWPWPV